jgi:putative ABC transport system substrate-binding protein
MNRRDFIRLLSAAAAAWPLDTKAQGPAAPVIGFFSGGSPYEWAPFVAAFRKGLSEMGYLEGRNAAIEFRWTYGDHDQVVALARDLVERQVDVIVTSGGSPPTIASMQLTKTIPIVATFGLDPVKLGLVNSFARPGGNVTGVSLFAPEFEQKRLQLLRSVAPKAGLFVAIMDPTIPYAADYRSEMERAAGQLGQPIKILAAATEGEIDNAFATLSQQGAVGVVVSSTAYYLDRRDRFSALAARYAIPTIYAARPYIDAGGLISYGIDRVEAYRQLALYTGRILRGVSAPAEMPVDQPTKYELAINLKTAKALGITIPPSLIALADVLIQ